jgi:uncharacterized membrane protein YgdD (TMEM256/DUF423 family)
MKFAWQKYFSALAALFCASSVAMSAYASHGLDADSQRRMLTASYFAFAHGLSLIVLVRFSPDRSNCGACSLMLLGLVLFSGSLASAVLFQTSTTLAPSGGMALILAWCWVAVNFLRHKEN